MAELKYRFLVTYDIRESRRLRRVYKEMCGYGRSLQDSVFLCHLTIRQSRHMRWRIEQLLAPEDSLLVIRLGQNSQWEIRGPTNSIFDPQECNFVIL